MRCVILQPSYIPWRGYFDLIRRADVFVFYDDVQYDKRGWRNRNRIKTPSGSQWLTIPVKSHGAQTAHIPINEIEVAGREWARDHLATLTTMYGRAPFFRQYREWLSRMYGDVPQKLADFTISTTIEISRQLGISATKFVRSSELSVEGKKTDRLIAVLEKLGADSYLSGPSARDYIEEAKFVESNIALDYIRYDYPEYPQLHGAFDPFVTVLDLLFMKGDAAADFIWKSDVTNRESWDDRSL